MMGLSLTLFFLLLGITGVVFWAWMIVDCAQNEPNQGNDKIVWILIIIFTNWIGALIYYFVRRPERIARFGS
jgi:hypothetical protein